ncbi:MAG: hypothetical protein QF473_02220 [Planctomycetota bacterium]|nr:hypothetical protein [Planctomycetota bacterium]
MAISEPVEAVILSGDRRGQIVTLRGDLMEPNESELDMLNDTLDQLIDSIDRLRDEIRLGKEALEPAGQN